MSSAAVIAKGTLLKVTVASTLTLVAEQVSIVGPGYSAATVEVTSHDSPSFFAEFIAGKKESGEVSFKGNYIPANTAQQAILASLTAGTLLAWSIVRPDSGTETLTFSALVTKWEVTQDYEKQLTVAGTLRITGLVTVTGT